MQHADFPTRARIAREAVAAASVSGDDAETFLRKVVAAVRRAVPHDAGGWCVTDPGTLLWTGGVMHGLPPEAGIGFVENELDDDDVLKFRVLAGARRPSGVLSVSTGGELERSPRYRKMYAPHGLGDELRVAAIADGACFANACLLRRAGAPPFTSQEVGLLEALSKDVAHGLRMAMAVARPASAEAPGAGGSQTAPGVLTVDDELRVVSATSEATRWLDELSPAYGAHELLPHSVLSVVRRARALADGGGADGPPRARVRARCGTWLAVHASALTQLPRTWAVVIEPARSVEVLPLVARAHELTAREHEVFGLLLRGIPDKLIAQRLVISSHTAREHVRSVLRKLGVHSRGELQAMTLDSCFTEPAFALVGA
jgi:DNA-binding CsgD family transcriptional regulator